MPVARWARCFNTGCVGILFNVENSEFIRTNPFCILRDSRQSFVTKKKLYVKLTPLSDLVDNIGRCGKK